MSADMHGVHSRQERRILRQGGEDARDRAKTMMSELRCVSVFLIKCFLFRMRLIIFSDVHSKRQVLIFDLIQLLYRKWAERSPRCKGSLDIWKPENLIKKTQTTLSSDIIVYLTPPGWLMCSQGCETALGRVLPWTPRLRRQRAPPKTACEPVCHPGKEASVSRTPARACPRLALPPRPAHHPGAVHQHPPCSPTACHCPHVWNRIVRPTGWGCEYEELNCERRLPSKCQLS